MSEFVASNGVKVLSLAVGLGFQLPEGAVSTKGINAEKVDALREFFQHERDLHLERWRWPEDPYYVIYADLDGDLTVVNELEGACSSLITRDGLRNREAHHPYTKAARAYFDAHPERRPWHDAKPGEVWVLTIDGEDRASIVSTSLSGHTYFENSLGTVDFDEPIIASARRIYPEDASLPPRASTTMSSPVTRHH